MTQSSSFNTFFLISFILVSLNIGYCQISWRIYSEAGFHNTSNVDVLEENNFCAKLNGEFGYKFTHKSDKGNVKFKFQPEWYGNGNENYLLSTKLKAEGGYFQYRDHYNWGIKLSTQKHNHNISDLNIKLDHYLIQFNFVWFILNNKPLNFNLGYGYQEINIEGNQDKYNTTDLSFFDCKIFNILSSFTKIGYGLYFERFSTSYKIRVYSIWDKMSHKGLKAGPNFCVYYLENYIINFDYRFLLYGSNITSYPSHEQWIRLLAGKLIFPKFSAFLLIDYFIRDFEFEENIDDNYYPLITPADSENRIYLKMTYDISKKTEVYIKSGYFKENLYYQDYVIEGWQGMIGVEFKN